MRLFLECYPDEKLAVAVGVPKREITHCKGKGAVSKNLRKNTSVMGLVDEDPGSSDTKTFSEYTEVATVHGIRLKTDKKSNNRLIVICPKLEDWVIETAKKSNVKMTGFSLSENPSDLHADINYRLKNFQELLAELLQLKSPRLVHLMTLLNPASS